MNRRNFLGLGLGLAPLLAISPALAIPKPNYSQSRSAQSGFLPNVPLITHNGDEVMFYDDMVRDKVILLNFFMITCSEGRCPRAMANIKKVQDLLGDRMGRDVFFLSITLRPEVEGPRALQAYAEAIGAGPGWTFLTGEAGNVDTLRRGLGFADIDPEQDQDLSNHIGMARYGDDKLNRWGAVALRSSASNIAGTFKWLSK